MGAAKTVTKMMVICEMNSKEKVVVLVVVAIVVVAWEGAEPFMFLYCDR